MCLLQSLFISTLLISSEGLIQILNNDSESGNIFEQHMSWFVSLIIEKYFQDYKCVVFILDENGNKSQLRKSNMIYKVLPKMSMVTILTNEEESLQVNLTKLVARYNFPQNNDDDTWTTCDLIVQALDECQGFVIQSDRAIDFMAILPHLYKVANTKSERKFVFIPAGAESRPPDLKGILQTAESGFILDVLYVLPFMNGCYPLATHLFDDPEMNTIQNLGNYCPEDAVVWSHSRVARQLFPNKLRNLHKRPLRFTSINYPPYHFFDNDNTTFDGLEIRIVKELANRLNGSFEFFPILDGELWGEMNVETLNATGLLGMLMRFEIEFGIASYYVFDFNNRYLDHSIYYLRAAMHCVAPKPQVVFDWEAPLLPFTSEMWIALGLTLLIVPTALALITWATVRLVGKGLARIAFLSFGYSLFATIGMLVSQPSSSEGIEPQRAPIDHFLLWIHVLCLLVSNSYSSGLSAILTVQRTETPIDTIYDLDRKRINWLAMHEAFTYALQPSNDPAIQRVIKRFKAATNSEMELYLQDPKTNFAYAIEVLANGNYAMGDQFQPWSMSRLRLMRYYLYYGWVATVTSKGSPYTNLLNELVFRLRESGILFYWEGDTARKSIGIRRTLAVSNSLLKENPPVEPLEWHHIQGTMLVLFSGYLLALLTFFVEILFSRFKNIKLNKHRRH